MKDRFAKISFLASGHIIQDVLITDPSITPAMLTAMLNNGDAVTTVQEGKDVCATVGDWLPIGEVVYTESEADYKSFELEDDYELESPLRIFNASRLARAGAIGEFISEADDLDVTEIMEVLKAAGNNAVTQIAIEEGSMDKTGNELIREIELLEHGLMNLMTIAHAAGKKGQEII